MQTAVIIRRDLNGFKIRQNHKTGFLNANDLLLIHNKESGKSKKIMDYLLNNSTKDYIDQIATDISQNSNVQNSIQLENGVFEAKKGRVNGGTWMHPYLFIDFAMWLSPAFKLSCVKWLHDNLIQVRDECGNEFKEVNQALFETQVKYDPFAYSNEAKMINRIVFGTSEAGQRNVANKEQLELLSNIQRADEKLIRQGLSYAQRLQELLKIKNLLAKPSLLNPLSK